MTRSEALHRARVWAPTPVESQDIRTGPSGPDRLPFGAVISCTYVNKPWRGHSSKFACDLGHDDVVKIKFGATNGEVYGEVAATRLLWALGFGADRMYPVRVRCTGCPGALGGQHVTATIDLFDHAVLERPMAGSEFDEETGWSWSELDTLDFSTGRVSRAEVDALKLLAVFMQHTDSKREQQRLLCLDEVGTKRPTQCRDPFLMIDDVGLTFGQANLPNVNSIGSANLHAWETTPVWRDEAGCVGNLPRSFTGTLGYPQISEAGRQFASALLARLSTQQLRDLFEVSQFDERAKALGDTDISVIDHWVRAFEAKRTAIATRRCPS